MKHRVAWIGLIVAIAVVAGLGEHALAQDNVRQKLAESSQLEEIVKRGSLMVGLATFVPWAMKSKTGELIGFEVDVAKKLAEDMKLKVEFVPTPWSGIIPALLTGKFDVIIGGMTITTERNLKVNFSDAYDYSGLMLVANKKMAGKWTKLKDFDRAGTVISARIGTPAAESIKTFLPKAQARLFDDDAQARQEVLNGKAHGFVGSMPRPAHWAVKWPDTLFLVTKEPYERSLAGFAVRKGDPDLLNLLNGWIATRKADGWLQSRHDYWFNTLEWEEQVAPN